MQLMSNRIDQLEDLLWDGGAQRLAELAGRGDIDAIYLLGMAHYDGDNGVEIDRTRCAELLQQAADSGHIVASHHLGCFRFYGYGFPTEFRDLRKAAELLTASATRGYPPSMTFLGSMYENGEGVERDVAKARVLYRAAADAGDELGQQCIARLEPTPN